MLSLIIVSLVAGVCFGQDPSKYSECDTVGDIAKKCASTHLGYVKEPAVYNQMQMLAQIDAPDFVVPKLDTICNDTMELKKYYVCAFNDVTTCLEEKNSTQEMALPDANAVAMGVVDLCKVKEDMNMTCLEAAFKKVEMCFSTAVQESKKSGNQDSDPCSYSTMLSTCSTAALSECDTGEKVVAFVKSALPRMCLDTSSAPHYLPSFLTLIMAMMLAHITFQ